MSKPPRSCSPEVRARLSLPGLQGIAGRWCRKPHYSLGDRELEVFADQLRGLRLLD